MTAAVALFVFGFLSGFLLIVLGRTARRPIWQTKLARTLGWMWMSAAFTLALALLGWAMFAH